MATESNLHQPSNGVRTYRGRTREEILPQIRSDLGADAVILGEREGLAGGVGDFLSQRFIEVDARRGERPHADANGGESPAEPRQPRLFEPDAIVTEPDATVTEPKTAADQPTELRAAKREPPIPPARRFETAVFMDRLREAAPTSPAGESNGTATQQSPAAVPDSVQSPVAEPMPAPVPEPAPAPAPVPEPAPVLEPAPVSEPEPPLESAPEAVPAPVAAPVPTPVPQPAVLPSPYEVVRRRPAALIPQTPLPPAFIPPLAAPRNGNAEQSADQRPATEEAPAPRSDARPGSSRRGAFSRFLESLLSTGASRPAPAHPLDAVAAAAVTDELSGRGASGAWTTQLISVAGAHGTPLAGDLRAAAEAEVARKIVPAPALPADGAAIAFVGAGGSGKTRCTAALASAYRRTSTLTVTVLALDNPGGARELRNLLRDDAVPVLSLSGGKALRAVEGARDGGLVIVDTGATTPTDPQAVQALKARLAPLELDAVYVTLPATLGPEAARHALASFATLQPSALAITHADETDQLAVAIEVAAASQMPLAYFHSGTDHRNALSAVDPRAVARRLLA